MPRLPYLAAALRAVLAVAALAVVVSGCGAKDVRTDGLDLAPDEAKLVQGLLTQKGLDPSTTQVTLKRSGYLKKDKFRTAEYIRLEATLTEGDALYMATAEAPAEEYYRNRDIERMKLVDKAVRKALRKRENARWR